MTDQEFVRSAWKRVVSGPYHGMTTHHFVALDNVRFVDCNPNSDEAWAAAAEFTRERLEQIRLIQEERVMLCGKLLLEDRDIAIVKRILVRLDAALADLKRGMKPTP